MFVAGHVPTGWDWEEDAYWDNQAAHRLPSRGTEKVCTREELLTRVGDICADGDLHLTVSLSELRSTTQVPPFCACIRHR